jgi:hypothetical protein
MNVIGAVEGGVTGTAALSLLQEMLHKVDPTSPRPLLHHEAERKKAKRKRATGKKAKMLLTGNKVQNAGELLANVFYFGLPALGDKNGAPLKGSIIGAAAGLWHAFGTGTKRGGKKKRKMRHRLYNLFLYTTAGLLAGEMIKHAPLKNKKQTAEWKKRNEAATTTPIQQEETNSISAVLFVDEVPVGYEIHKTLEGLLFEPTQYSAKECCPPRFSVMPDGESWLFEPANLAPHLQAQVVQEIRTIEAGNLL